MKKIMIAFLILITSGIIIASTRYPYRVFSRGECVEVLCAEGYLFLMATTCNHNAGDGIHVVQMRDTNGKFLKCKK